MTNPSVQVNGAKLSACLTCLLCNKLFRNATTISECLHTFCRECIDKKLIDEQLTHCPVCNVDLGCTPLEKLRPDRILQHLREKIRSRTGQNTKAPNNIPLGKLIVKKRKKKSLSSLKANEEIAEAAPKKDFIAKGSKLSTPKPDKVKDVKEDETNDGVELLEEVSTIGSARRAKAAARIKFIRTAPPPSSHQLDKVTREEKKDDNQPRVESSNGSLKIKIQTSTKPNSSQKLVTNKISRNNAELRNEKTDDMAETLNSLVESASKRKSRNKSTMQENGVTPAPVHSNDNDPQVHKVDVNKHCHRTNTAGDENESTPSESDSVKRQRTISTQEKTLKISEDLNFPAQPEIGTTNNESNKAFGPIWFCLVAAEEKKASARLPQISSCYLRIKDGSVPVSYIKKYLVKKLGLANESEVEITLLGQPVSSSLQLKNLVEMWLQTVPTNEIQTSVGSSAKDFIMILSYSRKA
ncbi:E3 ubiquitin protein ligase DRIP2 [Cajanus cajan]|nr:E3 ubiquitin protein ligase DRIP2 [Cajanus cajan]